jgi:hypothetical protein
MFTLWKLIPTVMIFTAVVAGFAARPPRTSVATIELIRLIAVVVALYLVGVAAVLAHRIVLAAVVVAVGLTLCGFAIWLLRGTRRDNNDTDDDSGGGGGSRGPAPTPGQPPDVDWDDFERQFTDYAHDRPPLARR